MEESAACLVSDAFSRVPAKRVHVCVFVDVVEDLHW